MLSYNIIHFINREFKRKRAKPTLKQSRDNGGKWYPLNQHSPKIIVSGMSIGMVKMGGGFM